MTQGCIGASHGSFDLIRQAAPIWPHRSRIRSLRILKFSKIHEFYWILKMPTEFYFEIQYFNFDWKITITLLQSQKHSTVTSQTRIGVNQSQNQQQPLFPFNSCFNTVHSLNVLQFNHKTYQYQSSKNSVHVIGLHDVTTTVGKTPLCKIWKSADAKKLFYYY